MFHKHTDVLYPHGRTVGGGFIAPAVVNVDSDIPASELVRLREFHSQRYGVVCNFGETNKVLSREARENRGNRSAGVERVWSVIVLPCERVEATRRHSLKPPSVVAPTRRSGPRRAIAADSPVFDPKPEAGMFEGVEV